MIMNKSVSLSDQVFDRIEEDILTGKHPRGTILTELGLCAELGVSRTPVREALARLEQEHIIESTGKGMLVLSITPEDAEVIYTIRGHVEGLSAAAAARLANEEQIAELRSIVEMQEYFAERHDSEKVKELDSKFHDLIYRCSGPIFYDTLSPLHKKAQNFRKASVSSGNRSVVSTAEHRAVMEAIAARDAAAAERLMNEHVKNARSNLHKYHLTPQDNGGEE